MLSEVPDGTHAFFVVKDITLVPAKSNIPVGGAGYHHVLVLKPEGELRQGEVEAGSPGDHYRATYLAAERLLVVQG